MEDDCLKVFEEENHKYCLNCLCLRLDFCWGSSPYFRNIVVKSIRRLLRLDLWVDLLVGTVPLLALKIPLDLDLGSWTVSKEGPFSSNTPNNPLRLRRLVAMEEDHLRNKESRIKYLPDSTFSLPYAVWKLYFSINETYQNIFVNDILSCATPGWPSWATQNALWSQGVRRHSVPIY